MGNSSQRRFLTSAPRKVQWAFNAADDLEKFRQSLSAQVNLVHITISKSILSIVARSNPSQQLLPGPARSNAFSREIYPASHKQSYLDWNYIQIDSVDMLDRVDDITDLVYKRLLARSGLSLTNHGRVHTLPDDASMSVSYPQLETLSDGRTPPFTDHSNEFPILNQQDIELTNKRTYSGHQDTLASEINEYLRSLSLEELSEQEAEHVNQIENSSQRFLFNGPGEDTSEPLPQQTKNNQDRPQPSGSGAKRGRKSKFRPRMLSFEFPRDALGSASLAIGIIQFIDSAAKTSFNIMRLENTPRELVMLSRRIMQYSTILETVTNVICTSMSAGQQRLGWEVIRDSETAMRDCRVHLE